MKRYFRVYERQTGKYMKFSYNANSKKELIEGFINFKIKKTKSKEAIKYYKTLGIDEVMALIEAEGYMVRVNNKPFKNLKIENIKWGRKSEVKNEDNIFKCRVCGTKFKNSFCSTKDVGMCKWCSGEEK